VPTDVVTGHAPPYLLDKHHSIRGDTGYLPSETRHQHIHVGSVKNFLFFKVSERRYPISPLRVGDSDGGGYLQAQYALSQHESIPSSRIY